ncbi:MAG TPA: DUF2889 domain-containing protein [Acidimicrobiales bacterium]
MADPTLADLRPAPGGGEPPVHRRTIEMEAYERDDYHVVIGTLRDVRPWASGQLGPSELHRMELAILVRRADLTIVDAAADMATFPHAECTEIEPAFTDLIGVSVARGYTSVVQEKFGRQRGCSHLEFLARALGPVVMQSVTSSAAMRVEFGDGEYPAREGALGWLTNTCHVWREDGPGPRKVEVGWRPGVLEYPAPSVAEVTRRIAAGEEG